MVHAAKAIPDVLSAERGVMSQDNKAYVYVRYRYRMKDGRVGLADYNRLRDAPLQGLRDTPDKTSYVLFSTVLSGNFPMCDRDGHGRPNCDNVRSWARDLPQPIPGWGTEAVRSAWQTTCGVTTVSLTL
jgi:hypothetical protein